MNIKRNIKDSVFTNMFGDKKYLLQMYKALHPEDTKVTEDDLNIVTLQNVLVNDLYNDLGFTVGNRLICLVEAQSTWSYNILIRVILYYANTLKEYVDKNSIDLYTTTKANIPKPEFYVVYTGDREIKPETLNFSKEFFGGADIGIDATVKMLYGGTDDIIGQYVSFTKVYNEQCKLYGKTKTAVTETIKICKDKNVLKEYIESREKELIDMLATLFDEELIMKAHDNTVKNQGRLEGRLEGKLEGRLEGIKSTVKLCKEFKKSYLQTVEQVIKDYHLDNENAEKIVKELW